MAIFHYKMGSNANLKLNSIEENDLQSWKQLLLFI